MQRKGGHPDFEYSRRKFSELDIEEQKRSELIERAFNRMNAQRKGRYDAILKVCPKCGASYETTHAMIHCTKCGSPLKGLPHDIATSRRLMEELEHNEKKTELRPETKRSMPVKKIVAVFMVVVVLGIFLWYAPTMLSMIPKSPSQSSYTKLTLLKDTSLSPNFTKVQFGDIDYFFDYSWQNNQYYLLLSNSLLETKSYRPLNGSVYRDIGIEMQVSEAYSDHIVLFVKPIQNYLAQSSFTKLTIAQGQYQSVNFTGNEYTIGYFQNPPYYVNKLIVMTPLLQSRDYSVTNSQIISSDLGIEIRVYKAYSQYVIVYVKPSY